MKAFSGAPSLTDIMAWSEANTALLPAQKKHIVTIRNELVAKAAELGKKSFHEGGSGIPYHSSELRTILQPWINLQGQEAHKIKCKTMEAYSRAWHLENARAPWPSEGQGK